MDINQIKGYFGTDAEFEAGGEVYDLIGFENGSLYTSEFGEWPIDACMLKLRPLSDLTEPCLDGGKTPIIELAKRCFAVMQDGDDLEFKNIYDDHSSASVDIYGVNSNDHSDRVTFLYSSFSQQFVVFNKTGGELVVPQLALFEMMYDMHMDLHGLIDKGDAIDINKLYE